MKATQQQQPCTEEPSTKRPTSVQPRRQTLRNLNPLFHKREKAEDNSELSLVLLKQARKSGVLNLSGRGLATVPDKVYEINQSDKDVEVTLDSLVAKEEDAWWNQVALTSLDLSSNTLTQLSPKIENLSSLTTLTLHNNVLTSLPKEIGKLEKLARVNLSRNKLKELPAEFCSLPDLRYLNLSHNDFDELNPSIGDLYMLEHLDASNNNLQSLPSDIGYLVRLNELLLANNHIKELPPDVVNMRSLKKLDLMHNDLIGLPEDIGFLRKLQCLYVQHNDIVELPCFDGCIDLQELHASNNFLSALPEKFCLKLPHLKILDLRDNQIAKLPDEVALLQSLIRLDISNNSINNLPCTLSSLPHLVSLQVEGNPIKSIRRDVLQCGTVRILKTLRDRSFSEKTPPASPSSVSSTSSKSSSSIIATMSGDGLNSPRREVGEGDTVDSVFPDKYKMRKTHCLTVTMKDLTDVPDKIFQNAMMENVNIIDFSRNRLERMPIGLQLLCHSASELVLSHNLLTSVPIFLSQFTRITLLNLACNNLRDFPKEIGVLNTLRELNISNNRFENLPACVYELKSLEILLAGDNRIKTIDATSSGLGAIPRLATLDLRNNNIEHVPPILGNLKNITTLDIMGNPFRQPRHQVIERGTDAIMSYLRDRIPS